MAYKKIIRRRRVWGVRVRVQWNGGQKKVGEREREKGKSKEVHEKLSVQMHNHYTTFNDQIMSIRGFAFFY